MRNSISNPINSRSVAYVSDRHLSEDIYFEDALSLSMHPAWIESVGLNINEIMDLDFHRYQTIKEVFIKQVRDKQAIQNNVETEANNEIRVRRKNVTGS